MTLRVLTYLAPSIPLGLFELVVERLRRVLGVRATLRAEARHSGPPPDIPDPFSADEADLAFLCSPSFAWLSGMRPSPIELVPAAPVFLEPRTAGRPEPTGFPEARVRPGAAFYSGELREFVLPYDVVRESDSPDDTLLDFLQTTYEAGSSSQRPHLCPRLPFLRSALHGVRGGRRRGRPAARGVRPLLLGVARSQRALVSLRGVARGCRRRAPHPRVACC